VELHLSLPHRRGAGVHHLPVHGPLQCGRADQRHVLEGAGLRRSAEAGASGGEAGRGHSACAGARETTTLGADGLFRFDGRSLADLLPEGRRKLDALASDIKASASPVQRGAGDRPHRPARQRGYNQALSLARAETVRDYLVQAGVPAQSVQVQGKGESEPKVQCAQASRAALIDCLAPNRRVEIEVSAGR
jgi:OOP family OmpA-OmpF porin